MAFEGSLAEFPVVDVIQFLYVNRRTGTLRIDGVGSNAVLVFSQGRIVACRHPEEQVNVGQILVELGCAENKTIDTAVKRQKLTGAERKPLVMMLLAEGIIDRETGRRALETLVERTVATIVPWKQGRWVFRLGEVAAMDDFGFFPEELKPGSGFDTQKVLMDAIAALEEGGQHFAQAPGTLPAFRARGGRGPARWILAAILGVGLGFGIYLMLPPGTEEEEASAAVPPPQEEPGASATEVRSRDGGAAAVTPPDAGPADEKRTPGLDVGSPTKKRGIRVTRPRRPRPRKPTDASPWLEAAEPEVEIEEEEPVHAEEDPPEPVRPPVARASIQDTRKSIVAVLRRHGAAFQVCALPTLAEQGPGSSVKLVLKFTVRQDGAIQVVRVVPASLEDTGLGRCLLKEFLKLEFPRHDHGTLSISFPLEFMAVNE